jgi:hypothetical protein
MTKESSSLPESPAVPLDGESQTSYSDDSYTESERDVEQKVEKANGTSYVSITHGEYSYSNDGSITEDWTMEG